jgi:hypothetical protein
MELAGAAVQRADNESGSTTVLIDRFVHARGPVTFKDAQNE